MGVHWNEVCRAYQVVLGPTGPDDSEKDTDDTPETPLDEPRPPRVQDPPPQPEPKGPYVVRARAGNTYGGLSGDYSRT
jgi:hypothetical protein